jgi:hypothetical protein
MIQTTHKNEKGVAILFTILLTSVLLLVALGISSVAFKEQIFSAEAREASKAFFAADTGIECALYVDSAGLFANPPTPGPFQCAGGPVNYINLPSSPTLFEFALPLDQSCAYITIEKDEVIGTKHYTRIEANGYNIAQQGSPFSCIATVDNPRIVTRALRVRYENP